MQAHTWASLVGQALPVLQAAGIDTPQADAKALAAAICPPGTHILLSAPPTDQQVQEFHQLVAKRAARIPLQHLIGEMSFRYLQLYATPAALVVRPETELLVEVAKDCLQTQFANKPFATCQAADLGTGSGAIALSLATEIPDLNLIAVDLSADALVLAAANWQKLVSESRSVGSQAGFLGSANNLDKRVSFALADFTNPRYRRQWKEQFELVVSNPPYVPTNNPVTQAEAKYDPPRAIYGGSEDGLYFPTQVIYLAKEMLKPGGALVMEHAENQAEALCLVASQIGFQSVRTEYDFTKRPRLLVAFRA